MAIDPGTRSVRTRKGSARAFRPAANYGQTMPLLWNTSKIDASLRAVEPKQRPVQACKAHHSAIGEDATPSVSAYGCISHEMPSRRIMRANLAMVAARRYADRTGCTLAQAISALSARRNANGSPRYAF